MSMSVELSKLKKKRQAIEEQIKAVNEEICQLYINEELATAFKGVQLNHHIIRVGMQGQKRSYVLAPMEEQIRLNMAARQYEFCEIYGYRYFQNGTLCREPCRILARGVKIAGVFNED